MRGALLLVLVLISTACGGLKSPRDGGTSGGTATGGGTNGTGGGTSGTGGGTSGTGGGTAGSGGGGGATGGGSGTGGGAPGALRYANIAIPTTNGTYIVGISGRAGETWAISDSNGIFRSTGGGFTEVIGTGLSTGRGIYVSSDGSVFPVGMRQLGSCMSNCTVGTSYTFASVSDDVQAVCGDSATNVYAVAEDFSSVGSLQHWDGMSWTKVVSNLGLDSPRACLLMPDHTLAIAGTKDVAFYSNGVTTLEHAATSPPLASATDVNYQMWRGIALAGTKLYAVGDSRRVSVRTAPDAWAMTLFTGATSTSYAAGATSESEVFAGGTSEGGTTLRIFNGTTWTPAPALPTITSMRAIYVASPNEIWFGGMDTNTNPVVDRATR